MCWKTLEDRAVLAALYWLVEVCNDDICGHCAHYVEPKEDEDFTTCAHLEAGDDDNNRICCEGVIEYFKQKEIEKL